MLYNWKCVTYEVHENKSKLSKAEIFVYVALFLAKKISGPSTYFSNVIKCLQGNFILFECWFVFAYKKTNSYFNKESLIITLKVTFCS